MQRQVTTVCPKTGRTIWVYEDLGPGAAKCHHGHGPVRSTLTASRIGHTNTPAVVVSRRASTKEDQR